MTNRPSTDGRFIVYIYPSRAKPPEEQVYCTERKTAEKIAGALMCAYYPRKVAGVLVYNARRNKTTLRLGQIPEFEGVTEKAG